MIDIDIVMVRESAVHAVSLVVAVRRLFKPLGLDTEEVEKLERSFRDAAAELQRVEVLSKDVGRDALAKGEGLN